MPDYKEMYLTLFRATEQAINLLIAAQQTCEDMYVNASEDMASDAYLNKRLKSQKFHENIGGFLSWKAGK